MTTTEYSPFLRMTGEVSVLPAFGPELGFTLVPTVTESFCARTGVLHGIVALAGTCLSPTLTPPWWVMRHATVAMEALV